MIFRAADQDDRGRIMKKITDVKPQVKTPTRCNIYLDNAFYCGLELETVMRHRLKIGDEISPERLDEIQAESESLRALDKALGFISRSQKTKKQVADYLTRKGYTEKTIEVVLGKMSAYKFVNDQNYANEYFRQTSKYKGKRLIYSELKRKGVSEEDMAEAMENVGDETESAARVAEKYLRSKEKTRENAVKCYRYLLSKGFDYETAKRATDGIIENEDNDF